MRRELGTWKKTSVAVLYQCVTAYGVSVIYYNFALLLSGTFSVWLILAVICILVPAYIMLDKNSVARIMGLIGKYKPAVKA